ncbi:MAG: hypothetical protein GX907_02325 [Clostridiaceae bacterium]|nr:hypothetical protein [Clostridiaceae bacterium]
MEKDTDKYNIEETQVAAEETVPATFASPENSEQQVEAQPEQFAEAHPEPVAAQMPLPPYAQQPHALAPAPAPAPAPAKAKRKGKHTGLIVGIIAAVLILAIVGVVLVLTLGGGKRDVVKGDIGALVRGPQLSYSELEILRARQKAQGIFSKIPFYDNESALRSVSVGLRLTDFPDDPAAGSIGEILKNLTLEFKGVQDNSDADAPRAAFDVIIKSETTGESVPASLQIVDGRIFLIVKDLLDKPLELPADIFKLSLDAFQLPPGSLGGLTGRGDIPGALPIQPPPKQIDLSKIFKGLPVPAKEMESLLVDLEVAFLNGANAGEAANTHLKIDKNATIYVGEKEKVELKVDIYEKIYDAEMIRDGFVKVLETVRGNDVYRQILLALYESQLQFNYPIDGDGNGALFLRPGESLRSAESFGIYIDDLIANLKENGLGVYADILLIRRIYAVGNRIYGEDLEVNRADNQGKILLGLRILQSEQGNRGALEISLRGEPEIGQAGASFAAVADYTLENGLATGTMYIKDPSGRSGSASLAEIGFSGVGTVPYKQRQATVGKFTLDGKMFADFQVSGGMQAATPSEADTFDRLEIELTVRGDDCVLNLAVISPKTINPKKLSFEITYRELSGEQAKIEPIDISLAVKPEELTPQEVGMFLIKLGGIAQKLGLESLLGVLFSGGLIR